MTGKAFSPDYLIGKAKEARQRAEETSNPRIKRLLEEVAEGFELLAEKAVDGEDGGKRTP